MSVQHILDRLQLRRKGSKRNPVNLVIVDACRSDASPSRAGLRDEGTDAPIGGFQASGTCIAYSCAPGRYALDGIEGQNGRFTGAFLTTLAMPQAEGMNHAELFRKVRFTVDRVSTGKQWPYLEDGINGEFMFRPKRVYLALEKVLHGEAYPLKPEKQEDFWAKVESAVPRLPTADLC